MISYDISKRVYNHIGNQTITVRWLEIQLGDSNSISSNGHGIHFNPFCSRFFSIIPGTVQILLPCGMGTRMSRQSAKSPTIPLVMILLKDWRYHLRWVFLLLDMCIKSKFHHYMIVTLLSFYIIMVHHDLMPSVVFDLNASTQVPKPFILYDKALWRNNDMMRVDDNQRYKSRNPGWWTKS